MSGSLALALLPWIVFALAARTGGLGLGAAGLLGCATAAAVAARAWRRGLPRRFEIAAVAIFAALAVVGFAVGAVSSRLDDWARVLGAGALTLLVSTTLARGRPFTEQYTTHLVPSTLASSPSFTRLNRKMTGFCALGAAGTTLSFVGGALFEGSAATTIFNWLFPLALVLSCTWQVLRLWGVSVNDDDAEDEALWASLATPPTIRRASPPELMARPLSDAGRPPVDLVPTPEQATAGRRRPGRAPLRPVPGGAGR